MIILNKISSLLLIGLARGYQLLISPVLPQTCRFDPTCSGYAIEAVQVHGAALAHACSDLTAGVVELIEVRAFPRRLCRIACMQTNATTTVHMQLRTVGFVTSFWP